MSAAVSVFQRVGDLSFPVLETDVADSLLPLDPPRAVLAGLFKAAINSELADAWAKVAAPRFPNFGPLPVADVLELEPSPTNMQQRKAAWPLLCVHRTGEATLDQITLFEERLTQKWAVHYILGPLDIVGERKLSDICIAIAKLIMLVVRQRGHKSYQNGALQFFPGTGGLASLWPKSIDGPGQAKFAGDDNGTTYYAMTLTLESTEITSDSVDGFGDFDGVGFSVGVGDADQIIPDLLQGDSSVPLEDD